MEHVIHLLSVQIKVVPSVGIVQLGKFIQLPYPRNFNPRVKFFFMFSNSG